MLLYAAIEIVSASGLAATIRPFLLLTSLWITYRTPHMLQQFAYRSGVGGGMAWSAAPAVHPRQRPRTSVHGHPEWIAPSYPQMSASRVLLLRLPLSAGTCPYRWVYG